jgi:hypothetical protein
MPRLPGVPQLNQSDPKFHRVFIPEVPNPLFSRATKPVQRRSFLPSRLSATVPLAPSRPDDELMHIEWGTDNITGIDFLC